MMKDFSILAILAAVASASATVPSLTPENYAELTNDKTVFLKFFMPKASLQIGVICAANKAYPFLTMSSVSLLRSDCV